MGVVGWREWDVLIADRISRRLGQLRCNAPLDGSADIVVGAAHDSLPIVRRLLSPYPARP